MNKILSLLLVIFLSFNTLQAQEFELDRAYNVQTYGEGETSVFFIAGHGCSGEMWHDTAMKLKDEKENYTCHVFSLAGFAGVDAVDDLPKMDLYTKALTEYISKKSENNAIIIGHGLGGFYALKIASENPPLVNKLFLIDALPFQAALFNEGITEEMAKQDPMSVLSNYESMEESQYMNMQRSTASFLINDQKHWEKLANWMLQSDKKTLVYTTNEVSGTDLRDGLKEINAQTVVLMPWMTNSNPNAPQEPSEKLAKYEKQYENLPHAKVIVADDTKKFVMFDQAEWFHNTLIEFLETEKQ